MANSNSDTKAVSKVAIDVQGVITSAPEFFSLLSKSLRKSGVEVHIVTNTDPQMRDRLISFLGDCNVEFDFLEITSDKAGYCNKNKITFALDDRATDYYRKSNIVNLGIASFDASD